MGDVLYDVVLKENKICCWIYVFVGVYCDFLVYFVCCFLENGVNSFFVNQIVDEEVLLFVVVCDLFEVIKDELLKLLIGDEFFELECLNLKGMDLCDILIIECLEEICMLFCKFIWVVSFLIVGEV